MNPPPLPARSSRDAVTWIWILVAAIMVLVGAAFFVVVQYTPAPTASSGEPASCLRLESPRMAYDKNAIIGSVVNACGSGFRSVYIRFNVFDAAGAQIDSVIDSASNLAAGASWKFEAPIAKHGAIRFTFSGINAIPE